MSRIVKIMIALILVMTAFLFLPEIGKEKSDEKTTVIDEEIPITVTPENVDTNASEEMNYWVNDSVYTWDDKQVNWIAIGLFDESQQSNSNVSHSPSLNEPIKTNWDILLDIQYRLKYFATIQFEMFAPIYGQKVEMLNGKEVIVEGFVIPFDEEGEVLALSHTPYSSCFFCGNASPASVISMYMKDKEVLYELDDFRKFKGTLILNYDDPDQFYYILENAEPWK